MSELKHRAGLKSRLPALVCSPLTLHFAASRGLGQKWRKADESEKPEVEVEDRRWSPEKLESTPFFSGCFWVRVTRRCPSVSDTICP